MGSDNDETQTEMATEGPLTPSRPTGFVLFLLPLLSIGCTPEPPPGIDLAAEAQMIRDLDAALSEAAQNRDAEAFASFFAEDAIQLPPGAPLEDGRAVIQEDAAGLLGTGVRSPNSDRFSL